MTRIPLDFDDDDEDEAPPLAYRVVGAGVEECNGVLVRDGEWRRQPHLQEGECAVAAAQEVWLKFWYLVDKSDFALDDDDYYTASPATRSCRWTRSGRRVLWVAGANAEKVEDEDESGKKKSADEEDDEDKDEEEEQRRTTTMTMTTMTTMTLMARVDARGYQRETLMAALMRCRTHRPMMAACIPEQ